MSDFTTLQEFFRNDDHGRRRNVLVRVNEVQPDAAGTRLIATDNRTGESVSPYVVDTQAAAYASTFQPGALVSLLEYGYDSEGNEVVDGVRTVAGPDTENLEVYDNVLCRIGPPDRRDRTGRVVQVATLINDAAAQAVSSPSDVFEAARDALSDHRPGARPGFFLRGVDSSGRTISASFFRPNSPDGRRVMDVEDALQAFADAPRIPIEAEVVGAGNVSGRRLLDEVMALSETRWEVVPVHLRALAQEHADAAVRDFRGDLSQAYRYSPGGSAAGYMRSTVVVDGARRRVVEAAPALPSETPLDARNIATPVMDPADMRADPAAAAEPDPSPGHADTVRPEAEDPSVTSDDTPTEAAYAASPEEEPTSQADAGVSDAPATAETVESEADTAPSAEAETVAETADDPGSGMPEASAAADTEPAETAENAPEPETNTAETRSVGVDTGLPAEAPGDEFATWLRDVKNIGSRGGRTNNVSVVKTAYRVYGGSARFPYDLVNDPDATIGRVIANLDLEDPEQAPDKKEAGKRKDAIGHRRRCLRKYHDFLVDTYPQAVAAAQNGQAAPDAGQRDLEEYTTGQAEQTAGNPDKPAGLSQEEIQAQLDRLGSGGGDIDPPRKASATSAKRAGGKKGTKRDKQPQASNGETPVAENERPDADTDVLDMSEVTDVDAEEIGDLTDFGPR